MAVVGKYGGHTPVDFVDGDKDKPIYAKKLNGTPICGCELSDGRICQMAAGHGTNHKGWGRCNRHGGNMGSKKGNEKSISHGLFSKRGVDNSEANKPLWFKYMTEEIKASWDEVSTDIHVQLANEIKLCDARIAYVMQKVSELEDEDFVIASMESGSEEGETIVKDGEVRPVSKKTTKVIRENAGIQISRWQDAITKIQAVKAKALDLKVKLELAEKEANGNANNMAALSKAIEQSARFLNQRLPYTPMASDDLKGGETDAGSDTE